MIDAQTLRFRGPTSKGREKRGEVGRGREESGEESTGGEGKGRREGVRPLRIPPTIKPLASPC